MALVTSKDGPAFLPALQEAIPSFASPPPITTANFLRVSALTTGDEAEVLSFLSGRPIHNVVMVSYIRDHGLVSSLNRGRFYACRNLEGNLEGVALIGHTMFFDAQTEAAIEVFANLARDCPHSHLLMGEHEKVQGLWNNYAQAGEAPSLLRQVLLLEQHQPFEECKPVQGLRPATLDDLDVVISIHAEMVFEESGIHPLETDPDGFRRRCARRIEKGRVWMLMGNGRPIFKADIIADTPEAVYIEGVYVSPQERRQGYGRRCLAQMGKSLLKRTKSICLFVDEQDRRAQAFYRSIGYLFCSHYNILYF